METPVIRKSVIRTQPQKRRFADTEKLSVGYPDRKPSFTPPSSSKRIGNMWYVPSHFSHNSVLMKENFSYIFLHAIFSMYKFRVAYDKETGRLIQRKIEATNKVISQHTQQFIQQFHSNEKKITPYNIQIRTLFRERITVKWSTTERMLQALSKHKKSVVKHIVSPENTISIRVDENTKVVENDSDEENRDFVNEKKVE